MITRMLEQPRQAIVKFGYAGLLFFTAKGLCWLFLPFIFAWYLQ